MIKAIKQIYSPRGARVFTISPKPRFLLKSLELQRRELTSVYDHTNVETKWQQRWDNACAHRSPSGREDSPKFYCLSMFPYPSGNLHMGHVRNYTISDCIARFKQMQGYKVLHPMGWDAFGLPAENAAIERGLSPDEWTKSNIEYMKRQLKSLGLRLDWPAEISTCDPEYYRWTQWIFLKLYERGLAYQKEATVNWDPVDQTVLANEQVDANGRSWRSGAVVEQRKLKQWFIRITDYADELLQGLDELDGWPDAVKKMQEAWIGKSCGCHVQFQLEENVPNSSQDLVAFTTRPDTLYGVTFVAVSKDHELVSKTLGRMRGENHARLLQFINREEKKQNESTKAEIDGVFLDAYVSHPLTGEKIPVWTANFVLSEYGTGVVMGVPAHDERDFKFAKANGIEIKQVIETAARKSNSNLEKSDDMDECKVPILDRGVLINSGEHSGKHSQQAMEDIISSLAKLSSGQAASQYRLRDWLVSRQRYWGAPVPMLHCDQCGVVPVPLEDLPVQLPAASDIEGKLRGGQGGSPLARLETWKTTICPCEKKRPVRRDTDTLDTFVDSSWYYLRYPDAQNNTEVLSPAKANTWLMNGVDLYIGGIEHAILHLLYSRFITKFLQSEGIAPCKEPFLNLLTQGMVLGRTYKSSATGKYLQPHEIRFSDGIAENLNAEKTNSSGASEVPSAKNRPLEIATGRPVEIVWEKMSKSKHNGVDPESMRQQYGADVTRLVTLFKAPPALELEWDEKDIVGQSRWLQRVWQLVVSVCSRSNNLVATSDNADLQHKRLRQATHNAIESVTQSVAVTKSFNVAIAELMKLSNILSDDLSKGNKLRCSAGLEGVLMLVTMMAPIAPHFASEAFETLRQHRRGDMEALMQVDIPNDVHELPWPKVDSTATFIDEIPLIVQVKGKTKEVLSIPARLANDVDSVREFALSNAKVQPHLVGKEVQRIIAIPVKGKRNPVINFVTI